MSHDLALDHRTLESYFFEEIEHAQERRGQTLPHEIEAYLVQLLATYARRTHAAGRRSRALALEYLRAKSETGQARAHALRRIGDRALYISGVVPRSLHRSPVNVRYVKGIGEAAYREVGVGGALEVLRQIADRFDEIAETIGDVVELGASRRGTSSSVDAGARELWMLVERWRVSRDPRDADKLLEAGVLISGPKTDLVQ